MKDQLTVWRSGIVLDCKCFTKEIYKNLWNITSNGEYFYFGIKSLLNR